jgi:hypothetical protein
MERGEMAEGWKREGEECTEAIWKQKLDAAQR